jgi:hypothetical protein
MFIPNTTGLLSRKTGKDQYSQIVYGPAVTVPCAIVHLDAKIEKTPVRADSSASRGNAEEQVSVSKILFPKTVKPADQDKFQISGIALRVMRVEERRDVLGVIDHYEVDLGIWQ